MKAEDLGKVQDLLGKLKIAESEHERCKALTTTPAIKFGMDSRCFIALGGDMHGNGTVAKVDFKILEIPQIVKHCHKLEAEAWSKVISIRHKLRTLGVELGA